MRAFITLVCLAGVCVPCFSQTPKRPAVPEIELIASDYGRHFVYSISRPELVRDAFIEVLDRPLVVAKKSVAVQAKGTVDWDWDRSELNFYEQPDDNLVLSVWDPNGESITCDVNGVMSSSPGGIVSSVTVGARGRLTPFPRLDFSFVRAAQGSERITFDVTGQDLSPSATFHVDTSRGGRCDNRSLEGEVLDLAHARITLGADCLEKAGILLITAEEGSQDGAVVHVASRNSPILASVSPTTIPDDVRQDKLKLVLRGHRFTKELTIYAGYYPDAGDYSTDQVYLQTDYISPTELRARVDLAAFAPHSDTVDLADGENLRIWVRGSEEKFELSEPRDVSVQSSGKTDRLSGIGTGNFRRWRPKTAVVTSVSPFPIKLMNEHSPEELKVAIHGQKFVAEDKIRFAFGDQVTNDKEVRSQFVSPTTMYAWLPRQLWRKHALSYRLVVETTAGHRYARRVDERDEQ